MVQYVFIILAVIAKNVSYGVNMNKIITISGRSTSGKSTLERMLVSNYPDRFSKIISHTTRNIRSGEEDGDDYYFVTVNELHETEMLEYVEFDNNMYGASKNEFERIFGINKIPVAVLTPEGVKQLQDECEKYDWEVISIFLDTPMIILLERFEERFSQEITNSGDNKKNKEIYESRLSKLYGEEATWINYVKWTHVFGEFSEKTETDIIDKLLSYT